MGDDAPRKLATLVDLERYPIDQADSEAYRVAVDAARGDLAATGCAVIEGMLHADGLRTLSREILECKPSTHYSTESINPYFHTEESASYPERHPLNTFIKRTSGFIPGDAWPAGSAMEMLFRSPELACFVADALRTRTLYCYADPLAGLTANILDPGQQFTWHFDTNEFAVTVLIDAADEGGQFEYVPDIRSATDENFDLVQGILEGAQDDIVTLPLSPGDLQIFRGRYSLHRVTRVGSASGPRHAAIFAYTVEPGVIGRVARTRQLFGRVLQEHLDAERKRVRSDTLVD